MICPVIVGPSLALAQQQIENSLLYAACLELRLDHFEVIDCVWLKQILSQYLLPMIFTLRKASQGGKYSGSEETRYSLFRKLLPLRPAFFDVEHDTPLDIIAEFQAHNCPILLSSHHFDGVPEQLDEHFLHMKKIPAAFYKIAVYTDSTHQCLRFMQWAKRQDNKLIPICMGKNGQISRILSPRHNCPITYVTIDPNEENISGQLSAQVLHKQYRYSFLHPETRVMGLIGNPVDQSPSHVTHNHLFSHFGLDAVYVKMRVSKEELSNFFSIARSFSFGGLSVTMPLKEEILRFLDDIDPEARAIGAVNTLVVRQQSIIGYNTDGVGALDALERKKVVQGKKMVLIGAGGVARAIAHEALKRGCEVVIVSREARKSKEVAAQLGCKGIGLDGIRENGQGYDFLINCTPHPMPIDLSMILPKTIAMDVTIAPKETTFLQQAASKNCQIVYGYEMFIEQALGQFCLWFPGKIAKDQARRLLTMFFNE